MIEDDLKRIKTCCEIQERLTAVGDALGRSQRFVNGCKAKDGLKWVLFVKNACWRSRARTGGSKHVQRVRGKREEVGNASQHLKTSSKFRRWETRGEG